ncbi:protein FAM177A1-like [Pholidichthys leucotaenia]
MADVSLYLTTVDVSTGGDADGGPDPRPARDFENVELEEVGHREEKAPRRIIHFSSGETMEEYSTDEEDRETERKDLLSSPVGASKMTWGPFVWFHMWRAATSTISACDYLGERMASLFGITSAKYQYAIDEYYRIKKEREEEKEENHLSEEVQRRSRVEEDEPIAVTGKPNRADAPPSVTYQVENEGQATSSTITVPTVVTTT